MFAVLSFSGFQNEVNNKNHAYIRTIIVETMITIHNHSLNVFTVLMNENSESIVVITSLSATTSSSFSNGIANLNLQGFGWSLSCWSKQADLSIVNEQDTTSSVGDHGRHTPASEQVLITTVFVCVQLVLHESHGSQSIQDHSVITCVQHNDHGTSHDWAYTFVKLLLNKKMNKENETIEIYLIIFIS